MTSFYTGGEVQLYDSFASDGLTSSLEQQLAQMYEPAAKEGNLTVMQMPVHQQSNARDCGVYSIAYAYHAAVGDDIPSLNFDHTKIRSHLISCFDREELSRFPVREGLPLNNCSKKQLTIHLP